ncbi:9b459395-fc4c-4947-8e55-981e90957acf-CDS [Sclerotinia trifoliorum]|uniref:9b459395-fc4c-4947-8e55-981e90957acf-CDS n=1 Tax=Sclerotinia trifoliorum TaxID=28548 RepID=A0A8H2VMF6_9HELO|nr:9b459395-fc4c-4947-8e55-981e90957acf-CDS [Sclerotinia trifoliorum]
MSKRAPSPISNPPVDDEVREKQKETRRELVKWYGDIRLALKDKEKKTAYKYALEGWKNVVNREAWANHGLIGYRLARDYLEAAAAYDIKGNRSKESVTVGFVEQFITAEFPEKRFLNKSQKGVVPRHGPEKQVDNFLAYTNVHYLETGLMMIESKRHPEDKEDMTKGRMAALETQVEGYCRQWLEEYKEIPFLYALTCVSTLMRVWVMERPTRSRDMKNAKLVGLWEPDKRTWDEYKDTGLDCDAVFLKTAFRLIKNNPTGSDYALTTSSDGETGDGRAGGRSKTATETRDETESEGRRTDKTDRDRSRNRRTDKTDRDRSRDKRADKASKPSKSSGKQTEASDKPTAQQSSSSRGAPREASNTPSERGDGRGGGNSESTSGRHGKERRRSRARQEPLPSSSPELPYRTLPKPRQSDRHERDETDNRPRRSDVPTRTSNGKNPEVEIRGKETATTGSSRKRADTTDSLSTRAPDSSGSENQRQPPKKSSKTALRSSANFRKSKPEILRASERRPGGGSNAS